MLYVENVIENIAILQADDKNAVKYYSLVVVWMLLSCPLTSLQYSPNTRAINDHYGVGWTHKAYLSLQM